MSYPAPYAADVRAKGWRFEIDYEKVKSSDTWLRAKKGDVRGALLLLWAESWQQTPCGSLPNDDELIALLIDMSPATFAKNKTVLLRGWALADDGRMYHETITERVLDMLAKRAKDAKRSADRRARSTGSDQKPPGVTGVSRVTPAVVLPEFDTKHQAPSINTVPIGTDGDAVKPASDFTKAELWSAGKSLLRTAGMPEAQCGSFVGKLCKDYGDAIVINAVRTSVVQQPADPASFLKAECLRLNGERPAKNGGKHAGFDKLNYREGVTADGTLI
jgi:hypothetical protein